MKFLKSLAIVALLSVAFVSTAYASGGSCAPKDSADVDQKLPVVEERVYVGLDGVVYVETNGQDGLQRYSGRCGGSSYDADKTLAEFLSLP